MSLPLASPLGKRADSELSSRRGDSIAPQATTTTDARTASDLLVPRSMKWTAEARPLPSTSISRTSAPERSVRRPVRRAAGSSVLTLVKIAPTSQPCMQ